MTDSNATPSHTFGYPNRMARIMLLTIQSMAAPEEYPRLLELAGLESYLQRPPPADLELGFSFQSVSAVQAAVETVYGAQAGRAFNQKVGRACLEGGLREFNPLLGIADLPTRLLPLSLKLHVGFDMFAMVFNRFTDQVVTLGEDDKTYKWIIKRCPVCWERHTEAPCCHMAVGILEEGLRWASGGKRFRVVETQCIATGGDTCLIEIDKRPIQS